VNLARPVRLPARAQALLISGLLAIALTLVVPSVAFGAADPIKGGTTAIDIALKKVKVKGIGGATKSGQRVTLNNASGQFDPVNGTGLINTSGGIQLKSKGKKVQITKVQATFGSGKISAKVGKKTVGKLASVSGGNTSRDDFGAKVVGAKAKLTKKGAKLLPGKGKDLGAITEVTVPKTVQVQPGGSLVFEPDPNLTLNNFLPKGVNPATGVEAVAPGVMHVTPSVSFEFPITGGSVALDLTDGRFVSDGGLKLTKTMAVVPPSGCESQYPVGSFVKQTKLSPDFEQRSLLATVDYQNGNLASNSGAGDLDLSNATVNVDHSTKQITASGIQAKLNASTAAILNGTVFGPSSAGCGPPSSDFKNGDILGTLNVSATLR
jgi:hypothetical protein